MVVGGVFTWEIGLELSSVLSETVWDVGAAGGSDTAITRGDDDGGALHAEFHDFGTLATLVGDRKTTEM